MHFFLPKRAKQRDLYGEKFFLTFWLVSCYQLRAGVSFPICRIYFFRVWNGILLWFLCLTGLLVWRADEKILVGFYIEDAMENILFEGLVPNAGLISSHIMNSCREFIDLNGRIETTQIVMHNYCTRLRSEPNKFLFWIY